MKKGLNFSERNGYIRVLDSIQIKSMSYELRNAIFNAIVTYIVVTFFDSKNFRRNTVPTLYDSLYAYEYKEQYRKFFNSFYANILKQKLTNVPTENKPAWDVFTSYFDGAEWHEVYSLVEWFIGKFITDQKLHDRFVEVINSVLEENLSGYRVVDDLVVPITDNEELSEISEALKNNQPGVNQQLRAALQQMHDKNYRHSVKESISAVETFVRTKTGKSTLGAALSELEKFSIPSALKQGFDKIYGWTCGPDGVRHALMDNAQDVTLAEAKFMLVACSAFLNYLTMKL